MKKQYLRVRIALLTLALGLASVNFFNWANDYWGEIPVDLPKAESAAVFEVITKKNGARFEATAYGCGGTNRYGGGSATTAYQTDDWQRLSVSTSGQATPKKARKEIEERIKDATKVLEDSKDFDMKSIQRRVVLEVEFNGKKWIDILQYDGEWLITVISAQSLELALELEQALELKN